eukprot:scaffold2043_cov51-Isochrysis_galbana.AAC.1
MKRRRHRRHAQPTREGLPRPQPQRRSGGEVEVVGPHAGAVGVVGGLEIVAIELLVEDPEGLLGPTG